MIQLLLRHSSLVIVIYCLFCGLCLNLDVLNSSLFGPSRISMTVCNRICSVIKGAGGLMPFRKIARLCMQQRFEFNCYLFSLTQSTFIMKGKNSIRVKLLLSLFLFSNTVASTVLYSWITNQRSSTVYEMSFMRSVNTGVYHSGISLTARYFYISDHWLTTLDDNGKKSIKLFCIFVIYRKMNLPWTVLQEEEAII